MTEIDMRHMDFIRTVAQEDVNHLILKERTYRGSWKKRGGSGAFFMLARKWDRLESMMEQSFVYDVFNGVERDPGGEDGTALAEIRDLRRYLLLVEAEMMARGVVTQPAEKRVQKALDELGEILDHQDEKVREETRRLSEFDRLERVGAKTVYNSMIAGARTVPRYEREYDGATEGNQVWPVIFVTDGDITYRNVDRRSYHHCDHLPILRTELNDKEHRDSPPEYRGMYSWRESDSKWILDEKWVEHWTK